MQTYATYTFNKYEKTEFFPISNEKRHQNRKIPEISLNLTDTPVIRFMYSPLLMTDDIVKKNV